MLLSGLISKYKTICKENRRHLSEISKHRNLYSSGHDKCCNSVYTECYYHKRE